MTPRRIGALLAASVTTAGLLAAGPTATTSAAPAAPATAPSAPSAPGDDGWRVAPDPSGGYEVSFTLDERLPVTGARPEVLLDGEPVGPALVAPDGRTLTLAEPLAAEPDVADLDVTLSGRPLDGGSVAPAPVGGAIPEPPTPGPVLDVDPAEPGDLTVATDDYDLDPFTADGLPNLETVGHVAGPASAGEVPVVVLLHGRHTFCYKPDGTDGGFRWPCKGDQLPIPSQLGYTYVQDVLASQGFLTISVAANGINAQDGESSDGGAQARADLVERHLDLLADGSLDYYLPAGTTPDTDQVVLVGHSRGGEGVNRLAETDVPGGAFEVVGQVLLGPTDFARQATPYVPSVSVLPYCDGDVSDLQGQLYTDVPRDLTRDDPALHSTVLVMGANHNYFNTEWTPGISKAPSFDDAGYGKGYCADDRDDGDAAVDDDPRLEASQQQDVGTVYIAGAVRMFTGESDLAPLFDGTGARAATTRELDIRSHAVGALRDVVRPGLGATPSGSSGADVGLCDGYAETCLGDARRTTSPHFADTFEGQVPTRPVARFGWDAAGATLDLVLDASLDLSDDDVLDVRVVTAPDEEPTFDVVLGDADGRVTVTPEDGGRVAALPKRQYGTAVVAQTLRVDLADVPDGVDLGAIESISLEAGTAAGRVWVLDAAGATTDLPDPGTAHAPAMDVEDVRVEEGDDPDGTLAIPYTLDAPAPADARVRVVPSPYGPSPLGREAVDVDVPEGSVEGTLEIPLRGDEAFGGRQRVPVGVFPVRGIATARSYARVTIREDDPRPTISVRLKDRTVREGQDVVVVGRLSEPLLRRSAQGGFPMRGPGPILRVADIGRDYLDSIDPLNDPRMPFVGRQFPVFDRLPAGQTRFVLRLPTRAGGKDEGAEHVTLRILRPGQPAARLTATVRD